MKSSKWSIVQKILIFAMLSVTGLGIYSPGIYAEENKSYYSHWYTRPILIREALLIQDTDLCGSETDAIALYGDSFSRGRKPTLNFGEQGNLTICSYTNNEIIASCPSTGCNPGDYLIELSTGYGSKRNTNFDFTVSSTAQPGQGPAGPQGEQGIQGEAGPIGPQGIQGEIGATGPAGPQGVQGIQGEVGPAGSIGPKGETGAAGPQGLQGEVGATGLAGPQGVQGIQGEVGPAGSVGPKGEVGATGSIGPQGEQGQVGAAGQIGPRGPQGEPGPEIFNFSSCTNVQLNRTGDNDGYPCRRVGTFTGELRDYVCPITLPVGDTVKRITAYVSDFNTQAYFEAMYTYTNNTGFGIQPLSTSFGNNWQTTGLAETPGNVVLDLYTPDDSAINGTIIEDRRYEIRFGLKGQNSEANAFKIVYTTAEGRDTSYSISADTCAAIGTLVNGSL